MVMDQDLALDREPHGVTGDESPHPALPTDYIDMDDITYSHSLSLS
jgi:hypothetical protein